MKQILSIASLGIFIFLFSCNGKNKESDVVYEYIEEVPELSAELQEKIGSWASEGTVCYGLLALIDEDGIIQEGAVIKAKIVRFEGDSIKMRSLTDKALTEVTGCDKMGISRGQTWWETEGEIFQEEAEAKAYLAQKMDKIAE